MKTPAYGPTEILRFPDGHCTIVTKNWWGKFLTKQEQQNFEKPQTPSPIFGQEANVVKCLQS